MDIINRNFPIATISIIAKAALAACILTTNATVQAATIAEVVGGDATFNINELGQVSAITGMNVNGVSTVSYYAQGVNSQSAPLVSLIVADSTTDARSSAIISKPTSFTDLGQNLYQVQFADGINLTLRLDSVPANGAIPNSRGYMRVTVMSMTNTGGKDIRALSWGPIPVNLSEKVADVAGVVYDRDFAVGLTGLNVKTNGGIPLDYWSQFVADWAWVTTRDGLGGRNSIALSSARTLTNGNATLQASTMDYSVARTAVYGFDEPNGVERPIPANPSNDAKIVGSSIALYGVSRRSAINSKNTLRSLFKTEILATIESIEKNEQLPYTTAGGAWAKTSEANVQRLFGNREMSTSSISSTVNTAKAGGFTHLYQWYGHNGVFNDSSPFFSVNWAFGGSLAGLKSVTDTAKGAGLPLGTHTLTGFVFVGDPVTNTAAASQVTANTSKLLERTRATTSTSTASNATTITVTGNSDVYTLFKNLRLADWDGGTGPKYGWANIGSEIITYTGVTEGIGSFTLTGVLRGRYGTVAANYAAGTTIRNLEWWGGYNALAWDDGFAAQTGLNLASAVNAGGLGFVSNDGIESFYQGQYRNLSLNTFYKSAIDNLTSREFTSEGSIITPYTWHFHNRFLWGEGSDSVFRQTPRYRVSNSIWYSKNLLPANIGGYNFDDNTIDDINWMGAHMAAFRGGILIRGFNTSNNSAKLAQFKAWADAMDAGAVPDIDRMRMLDWKDSAALDVQSSGRAWKIWEVPISVTEANDSRKTITSATYGNKGDPRYISRPVNGFSAINIAPNAHVTVSSQDNALQGVGNLVDEFSDVDSADNNSSQGASTWKPSASDGNPSVSMTWDKAYRVQALVVHNAPGTADATNAFTVTWSDGSTMNGTLGSDSKTQVIPVDNVITSSMNFRATNITGQGGLAELSVIAEVTDIGARNIAGGKAFKYANGTIATQIPSDNVISSDYPKFIDIGSGAQAITVDLGANFMIDGLRVWRFYGDARTYKDVIYEISTNADFTNSTKVFNSNTTGSLGLGNGSDFTFSEKSYGHPVYFAPVEGRYVRLWSNGSSANNSNHYVEVQVFGAKNVLKGISATASSGGSISNAAALTDGTVGGTQSIDVTGSFIQFDLGAARNINALRVYRDASISSRYTGVIWQLSSDPNFSSGVKTVFNNDSANVFGQGAGRDSTYRELATGKIVEFDPTVARYIRLYSGANNNNSKKYIEVEAYEVN